MTPAAGEPRPLTGRMAEQALAFVREGRAPADPRPASTVMLVRDGAAGLEVYLLRRAGSMAFAAGMSVFPGGRVDPTDSAVADAWSGPPPGWFASRMSCPEPLAVAHVAAAIRETFEESGVLLAGPSGGAVVADTTGADWEADRVALEARALGFSEFLHRRGLVLRADLLGPWAHWITPEFEPRRYDTRFFVAALPAGQRTRDVSGESDQVAWMSPADAVTAVDAGELEMLPPTYLCCHQLAAQPSVAAALDAARDQVITPILPALRLDGDQAYLEGP
jgi:8-oxo-dGTP pyrophosphatase MutT (NUDIX family)